MSKRETMGENKGKEHTYVNEDIGTRSMQASPMHSLYTGPLLKQGGVAKPRLRVSPA